MSEHQPHIHAQLQSVASGDETAFRALVHQYAGTVHGYVLRLTHETYLAEEVVQDVFVQLWQTRELLATVDNFDAYLYVISRNYALNAIKKMLREKARHVKWENEVIVPNDDNPIEMYQRLLDEAIAGLPPQQQRAWILGKQMRMTYAEIAHEMNISKETVKKYLKLATANIADHLRKRSTKAYVNFLLFFF